jgi:hypothetical protein
MILTGLLGKRYLWCGKQLPLHLTFHVEFEAPDIILRFRTKRPSYAIWLQPAILTAAISRYKMPMVDERLDVSGEILDPQG